MSLEQAIVAAFLLSFPILALIRRSSGFSIEKFFLDNRKLGYLAVASGVSMTFAGGAATLNMASLGYQFGWTPLLDPFSTLTAIVFVSIFMVSYIRSEKGVSIADTLSDNSTYLSFFIGSITFIVYTLIASAQAVAIAKILSIFYNIDISYMITISSLIVFTYVIFGGLRSVTCTDALQLFSVISFLVIPIIIFLFSSENKISDTVFTFNHKTMPTNLLLFMLFPIIFVPVSQDIHVRIRASKSMKTAIGGIIIGALFYFLITSSSIFTGVSLYSSNIPLNDPEDAILVFFSNSFGKYQIIATLAIIAAVMSSFDSFVLNSILSLSNDVVKKVVVKDGLDRSIILISSIVSFSIILLIATKFQSILSIILLSLYIYVSILIPILIGKYIRIKSNFLLSSGMFIAISMILTEIIGFDFALKPIFFLICHILLLLTIKTIWKNRTKAMKHKK